jgi:hypothetical protein
VQRIIQKHIQKHGQKHVQKRGRRIWSGELDMGAAFYFTLGGAEAGELKAKERAGGKS